AHSPLIEEPPTWSWKTLTKLSPSWKVTPPPRATRRPVQPTTARRPVGGLSRSPVVRGPSAGEERVLLAPLVGGRRRQCAPCAPRLPPPVSTHGLVAWAVLLLSLDSVTR